MKRFRMGFPNPQDWFPRLAALQWEPVRSAFAAIEEWKKTLPEGILARQHPAGFLEGGSAYWFPDDSAVEIESRIAAILNLGASRWEMVFVLADGRIHMDKLLLEALRGNVPDLLHLKGLWPGGRPQ